MRNPLLKLMNRNGKINAHSEINTVSESSGDKAATRKKRIKVIIIFLILSCAGFALGSVSYLAKSGGLAMKGITQRLYPQTSQIIASRALPSVSQVAHAAPQMPTPPIAASAAGSAPQPSSTLINVTAPQADKKQDTEGAIDIGDVFKDFAISSLGKKSNEKKTDHLTMPAGVPPLPNSSAPVQLLMVKAATPPKEEHLDVVKVYSIVCVSEGPCSAVTSAGVLKVGDKVGSETIITIADGIITTDKRPLK